MVKLTNVIVHYGAVAALKDISIEAAGGCVTALIGANGAGKSTCLRAISGLVKISAGEIWFRDQRIDRMAPHDIAKLGISHVLEGKRLFLGMSVNDNLLTGAHLREDKEGIKKDLELMYDYFPSLAKARNRQASRLSGGEQQMLAIGRGLMAKPMLLMLDEPSLGLSPVLTEEVASIIKKVANVGLAILLIEQNAGIALDLASRCYVLETGRVSLEGDAEALQNNEYVRKAYLGI